ncbi:MAG TPA: hypothetical protein VFV25_09940 [Methylibium sp.]
MAGIRAAALLLAGMVLAAANAHAQGVYRCSNGAFSDRPCGGPQTSLTVIGPVQTHVDPAPSYIPPVGKAPEHLQYLSPACASLNDAMRTAPARGLRGQALGDLQAEYRAKCDEEDQAARARVFQDKLAQRNERRSQQVAQQAEHSRQLATREQCSEMLRILHGKRQQQGTMTSGEKADFQHFEDNYTARCKAP